MHSPAAIRATSRASLPEQRWSWRTAELMQGCRIGFGAAAVGHNNGIAAGMALQVDRCTIRSGAQESGIIAQGVSMVRSLEQTTMRRVYLRILPFAALTYF